jgi:hypothetical protein
VTWRHNFSIPPDRLISCLAWNQCTSRELESYEYDAAPNFSFADETPGSDPPYLGIDPGLVDPLKSGLEQARIPPPSPAGSPEFWTHVIR